MYPRCSTSSHNILHLLGLSFNPAVYIRNQSKTALTCSTTVTLFKVNSCSTAKLSQKNNLWCTMQ